METTENTEVFIGSGPGGQCTMFATRSTIEKWVSQGYAHESHDEWRSAHKSEFCNA